MGVLIALVLFWGLYSHEQNLFRVEDVRLSRNVVVGPITPDDVIEQPILISDEVISRPWGIAIKMATYGRDNRGALNVVLSQGGVSERYRLESVDIQDNAFIYLPVNSGEFVVGKATLRMQGEGNDKQTAPTAWSMTARSHRQMLKNGVPSGRELNLRFFYRESYWDSLVDQLGSPARAAMMLGVFVMGMGTTLFLLISVFIRGKRVDRSSLQAS